VFESELGGAPAVDADGDEDELDGDVAAHEGDELF
jgi:hypothetical protein